MENYNVYTVHDFLKMDQHNKTMNPMVIMLYAMIENLIPHGSPKITSYDTKIMSIVLNKEASN